MTWMLFLACRGEPQTFDECEDVSCRARMALRDWSVDQAGTSARVAALPDELERVLIVEKLVEAYPAQTGALCAALPQGRSRERCQKLNGRPHLGSTPGEPPPPSHTRTAPGPSMTVLPLATLPLAAEPAPADPCADLPNRGECVEDEAAKLAKEGHAGAVPEHCARASSTKFRDECVFHAAEEVMYAPDFASYPTAASLCAAAGEFVRACQTHLLQYTVRATPRAESMTEADVKEATAFAKVVRDTWAQVDPSVADVYVGWFWSRWIDGAYAESKGVPGTPAQWLPEEAMPHLRSSLVARLQSLGRMQGTLAERVALAETALANRPEPSGNLTFRVTQGRAGPRWGADGSNAEAKTPAVWYLGNDRRPTDADAKTDLALAVVAAAAHAEPEDTALLKEAAGSDSPVVQSYAKWLTRRQGGGQGRPAGAGGPGPGQGAPGPGRGGAVPGGPPPR